MKSLARRGAGSICLLFVFKRFKPIGFRRHFMPFGCISPFRFRRVKKMSSVIFMIAGIIIITAAGRSRVSVTGLKRKILDLNVSPCSRAWILHMRRQAKPRCASLLQIRTFGTRSDLKRFRALTSRTFLRRPMTSPEFATSTPSSSVGTLGPRSRRRPPLAVCLARMIHVSVDVPTLFVVATSQLPGALKHF